MHTLSGAGRLPILIVEDNSETNTVMARMVKARGFEVLAASGLDAARALATAHKVGFLISDIGLPDGSGLDLMREMHEQYGTVGVAITGYGTEADVEKTRQAGFAMHFTKPIAIETLEKILTFAREVATEGGDPNTRSVAAKRPDEAS